MKIEPALADRYPRERRKTPGPDMKGFHKQDFARKIGFDWAGYLCIIRAFAKTEFQWGLTFRLCRN